MSNNDTNTNQNMGLLPKIWGPHLWEAIHSISFSYPVNPTIDEKNNFKNFFQSLSFVLPCAYCRNSYAEFIKPNNIEHSNLELNDNCMENRDTLTLWLWKIHNAVNKKLGVDYMLSYPMLCDKYNSYRAQATMTPETKKKCYIKAELKCTPYIDYELAKNFSKYAQIRKLTIFDNVLEDTRKITSLESEEWLNRNKQTCYILKKMRLSGKTGIETTGIYKGLPTIYELALLQYMSTSMSKNEVIQCIKKLEQFNF